MTSRLPWKAFFDPCVQVRQLRESLIPASRPVFGYYLLLALSAIIATRGQLDDSRPGNDQPVTGSDLRAALDAALAGGAAPGGQKPSMGCNIKWRGR